MPTIPASPHKFAITPHPLAPILSDRDDAPLHIQQLISEATSQNSQYTEEVTQLMREACYVSLYFFLKCVCAYSGPYEKLNDTLHLDMCNFRQSKYCMDPGSKAAGFIPRGFFKSSIFTHGADTWECIRNPNIRIAIINAVVERAQVFMHNVQRNFDSNPIVGYLFPDCVPKSGDKRWNDSEMVLPNRTKHSEVPTIKPLGATSAGEGLHVDLEDIDDLCGLDDLDRERKINASMLQRHRWWETNTKALLLDWNTSRIVLVATLYSVDDPYYQKVIMKNMFRLIGYQDEDMVKMVNRNLSKDEDRFTVYFRQIVEDDKAIFPEGGFTKEAFEILLRDKPWTAMTQYMNKPTSSGLAEFHEYETGSCIVSYMDKYNDYVIVRENKNDLDDEAEGGVRLGKCDCVVTVDPAGTDTGITAKTSRSSVGFWAMDSKGNAYRLAEAVGYFSIQDLFDKIFEVNGKFDGYSRGTFVESSAMQKILAPLLEGEQERRGVYISPEGVPAKGDKKARIRSNVGSFLARGKVWLATGCAKNFIEEQKMFPMSERLDVLDESEKALTILRRPLSEDEELDIEERALEYEFATTDNRVGY